VATQVHLKRCTGRWFWLAIATPLLSGIGLVALSALSNLTLPSAPAKLDQPTALDKARLQEALHLKQALGEAIWPGYGEMEVPVMLWNREYVFLIGYPNPPTGWEKVAADDFAGQPYYRQSAHEPQNFAVRIGDGWAASMATKWETDDFLISTIRERMPGPLRPIVPYRLIIQPSEVQMCAVLHEAFHVYQVKTAKALFDDAERAYHDAESYWAVDAVMRSDWKSETDLLFRAVRAQSESDARDLARQFLAQRSQRRQAHSLGAPLVDYERRFEWLEGLAKYVELEAWRQASATPGYTPLPALKAAADFKNYATFSQRWSQELDQMKRQAGQEGETRFYYTGLAEATLLDRFRPGWKALVMAQGAWLEDLLRSAVQLP
jgi:hypothetical protein